MDSAQNFINQEQLAKLLLTKPDAVRVREVIAKALAKEPLHVEESAALLNVTDPDLLNEMIGAAQQLKRDVYGNRIVLFAPLYVGNRCINDCAYCGFRTSNHEAQRRTLSDSELDSEVRELEKMGHKRLIVVFGEHPDYDAEFIASTVRQIYSIREGNGEIRRVNVNAAPFDEAGFRTIKEAGIGTYQVFMETYHRETYARMHPARTRKGDYLWRLTALDRAYRSGCDDVGIGCLFGLTDWRFDVLGLVAHSWHLTETFGCGPHTISFPRLKPAPGVQHDPKDLVSDAEMRRLVAILRLSVPYTGLILTAREPAALRRELMQLGVSQIDAGSRIEIGGYTTPHDPVHSEKSQFALNDTRTLEAVIHELIEQEFVPSFCTSCYRKGRTGQQFMEFAVPGFIGRLCTPNALTTLMEYLLDYASPETVASGRLLIQRELEKIPDSERRAQTQLRLQRVEQGERDIYF